MDLIEILSDQRKDLEGIETRERLVDRDATGTARELLRHPNIVVVTGVRRCGKSIFSYLAAKGNRFGYVNFDDERLAGLKADDLNSVLEGFYEIYGDIDFIILDEVQNVEGWELFASRSRLSKRVMITGSNSQLLSGELASRLTGRYSLVPLFPLSFKEYLDIKGELPHTPMTTKDRAMVLTALSSYIEMGGFPEVFKFGRSILPTIYDNIITKDIVVRHRIRKPEALRQLARYLMTNHSREFTYSRLSKVLDVKRTDTVSTWISYLEEAFLVFHLDRFNFKLKEQFRAPKKIYGIDMGMIRAAGFSHSQDLGRAMENTVAVELMRRKAALPGFEVYYWKDHAQNEVDFVLKQDDAIKRLIQVTYARSKEDLRWREVSSLLLASKHLRCTELLVLTWDLQDVQRSNGLDIVFKPLWKWLLEG